MREEAIQLETLRQRIEAAEYESGNLSDYIDRGGPSDKELKAAQERIGQMNREAASLKVQLRELIAGIPREALEEWVNWHKNMLEGILNETPANPNSKTRLHVARITLDEWDKVLQGEREHVNINWYFLQDYKEAAQRIIKGGEMPAGEKPRKKWWKFWE
jgi:hypothetical protein